jgi:hypothetical protein
MHLDDLLNNISHVTPNSSLDILVPRWTSHGFMVSILAVKNDRCYNTWQSPIPLNIKIFSLIHPTK